MGPKVEAAIKFVVESKSPAAFAIIGDLRDAADLLSNKQGTIIRKGVEGAGEGEGVEWRSC